MNLITWLLVGSISGWLAEFLPRMDEQSNLRINMFVGIVGAIVAGIFITPLFDIVTVNQRTFSLPSMLVALGGAVILITVVYLFRRLRTNTS
jgi:uncharacterized membrane protein YeaQ/YmgE (transglycosylase-associated protein family)